MLTRSPRATRLVDSATTGCLGLLLLAGCGGSSGGAGDGGFPVLPGTDAAPPACGTTFNACGGSVVGVWKYPATVECGPAAPIAPPDVCPGYSRTGEAKTTGAMTFSADGTWDASMVANGTYQVSYPVSCMGGSTCATSSIAEPGMAMTCSETPPGTCHCEYVFDNYALDPGGGTYITSGGKLITVDSDGSAETVEYCVQGNTLRVHATDSDTGEPMTIVFTKQ